MRKKTFLLAFTLVSGPLQAEAKKPFQIQDLYDLKSISQLALSPDGSKLVFTVTGYELEAGKTDSDLHLLDLASGEARRLTRNPASDSSPVWSPDGRQLYFLSSRNEGIQLWRLPVGGGESEQLTQFPPGVANPRVAPDGKTVFFNSSVFPECGADGDCHRRSSEKLSQGPVRARLADELLFRHWDSYRDFRYSHLFKLDLETGKITPLTEGERDYPTYGGEFVLSPDGNRIVVTVNTDEDAAMSTNSDLWLLDTSQPGTQPQTLTAANAAFDGTPRFSPDGRKLAFRMQRVPSYESDRFLLAVMDLETRETRVLSEAIDNWVESLEWAPDSSAIYFTVQEKGSLPIYKVDLESGETTRLADVQAVREMVVSPDGRKIYLTRTSVAEPVEIFALSLDLDEDVGIHVHPERTRLTAFNQPVADRVDIRPAESIWVEGAGGHPVQVFLVKPHGFDPTRKYPLILNIHGGPQFQWLDSFRADWQVYPGAGYIVAFPNPHGSTGYGQAYTEAISGDYGGRVMEDIDRVAAALASLPYVDAEHMGAMGWSWGGYAMMWLEGNSTRFKALAAMMGIFDLASMYTSTEELWFVNWDNRGAPWENPSYYDLASPSSHVQNFRTPCLVITGEKDYRVPYTQSLQFFTALQKMGVPSRLIVFENDGHWPDQVRSMPVYYNAHLEWFHRFLGGEAAPYDTERLIRNLQFEESGTTP